VWCPDGRRIVFSADDAAHGTRLHLLEIDGGRTRPLTPEGVRSVSHPVSPDGRFVAAIDADGVARLYPLDGGPTPAIPGFESDDQLLRFGRGGRILYVYRQGEVPARVFRLNLETGSRTLWRELAPPDTVGVRLVEPVLLAADERAYAYGFQRILSDLYLVEGLR
jgi:hypothetical protein